MAVRLQRLGLRRGVILPAVLGGRARVDKGLESDRDAGLDEVHGTLDVRADHLREVRLRRVGAVRGQVEDPVGPDAGDLRADLVLVGQVYDVEAQVGADVVDAPGRVPGTDGAVHVVSVREEAADQVRADEAGGSGDERARHQTKLL